MATAQQSCENVLLALKSSNLNFLIQESPYSVYITVRKRFIKNSPQKIPTSASYETNNALEVENAVLKKELEAKNTRCKDVEKEIELLEVDVKKLNKAVANVTQVKNETENELKVISNLHKNVSNELQKTKNELKVLSKNIKSNEKEIYNLTNKNENLQETLGRIKVDNATLKKEKKTFEKKRNKAENKAEDLISMNNKEISSKSVHVENPEPPIQMQASQFPEPTSLSARSPLKYSSSSPSASHTPPGTPPPVCSEPSHLSSPEHSSPINSEDIIKFADRFNTRMEEQTKDLMAVIKENFKFS